MTDEELQAIKARADAATPGPWEWRTEADRDRIAEEEMSGYRYDRGGKQLWPSLEKRDRVGVYEGLDYDTVMAMPEAKRGATMPGYVLAGYAWGYEVEEEDVDIGDPDAEFIAHARTDVPALVAEVERLRGLISLLIPMGASLEMEQAASDAGFELASDWMEAALGH